MQTAYLHDTDIYREESEHTRRRVYRRPIRRNVKSDNPEPAIVKVEHIDHRGSEESEIFMSVDGVTVYAHPNLDEVAERMFSTAISALRREGNLRRTIDELHRHFGAP